MEWGTAAEWVNAFITLIGVCVAGYFSSLLYQVSKRLADLEESRDIEGSLKKKLYANSPQVVALGDLIDKLAKTDHMREKIVMLYEDVRDENKGIYVTHTSGTGKMPRVEQLLEHLRKREGTGRHWTRLFPPVNKKEGCQYVRHFSLLA